MKKNLFYATILCIAAVFTACSKDEDPTLTVDTKPIVLSTNGETVTLGVTSNNAWTVAVPADAADWLTVTPTSGSGDGQISITAKPTIAAHRASISVSVEGLPAQTINISQDAADLSILMGDWQIKSGSLNRDAKIAVDANDPTTFWISTVTTLFVAPAKLFITNTGTGYSLAVRSKNAEDGIAEETASPFGGGQITISAVYATQAGDPAADTTEDLVGTIGYNESTITFELGWKITATFVGLGEDLMKTTPGAMTMVRPPVF